MTNAIHIMLDLETWGKKPGCDIRSIGACVFDPVTGDVSIPCQTCKGGTTRGNVNDGGDCSDCMNTRMQSGYGSVFYQAVDNSLIGVSREEQEWRLYNLHRDPETVAWWNDQSADAQAAFADPVDLADGLREFTQWFQIAAMQDAMSNLGPGKVCDGRDIRLWAHGPQFDMPIAAAAYDACGLPVPWHYRAPRDTRTIFDAAGIEDHSAWLKQHPGPLGILHHALDDAICQARAVCAASAIIAGWKHGHDDNVADRRNAYRYGEDDCPGHVSDPKRCANCGIHIDSFRPSEDF